MAKHTTVVTTCDLHEDDDPDEQGEVEEISFALDGTAYAIDLCEEHAHGLRDALALYVANADKPGRRSGSGSGQRRAARSSSRASSSRGSADRDRVQAVRQWARENGHQVSDRGRLPAGVVEAYEAAH